MYYRETGTSVQASGGVPGTGVEAGARAARAHHRHLSRSSMAVR